MKNLLKHPDSVMCMSNVRGKYVVHPGPLKFSFYFFLQMMDTRVALE